MIKNSKFCYEKFESFNKIIHSFWPGVKGGGLTNHRFTRASTACVALT